MNIYNLHQRKTKAQTVVLFALSLAIIMAVLALVVDVGQSMARKRAMQNAADAAALAGTREIAAERPEFAQTTACSYAVRNGFPDCANMEITFIDGAGNEMPMATASGIRVNLQGTQATFWARTFGDDEVNLQVNSAAATGGRPYVVRGAMPIAIHQDNFSGLNGPVTFLERTGGDGNTLGEFSWTGFLGNTNANDAKAWIKDGGAPYDIKVGEYLDLTNGNMTTALHAEYLQQYIGKAILVPMTNDDEMFVGFATFFITDIKAAGNPKGISGYFVPGIATGGRGGDGEDHSGEWNGFGTMFIGLIE